MLASCLQITKEIINDMIDYINTNDKFETKVGVKLCKEELRKLCNDLLDLDKGMKTFDIIYIDFMDKQFSNIVEKYIEDNLIILHNNFDIIKSYDISREYSPESVKKIAKMSIEFIELQEKINNLRKKRNTYISILSIIHKYNFLNQFLEVINTSIDKKEDIGTIKRLIEECEKKIEDIRKEINENNFNIDISSIKYYEDLINNYKIIFSLNVA